MSTKDLTKEQLFEQISTLQERIDSLEEAVATHNQIEKALSTSEKNLSVILEKNADGIVIVDMDGIVLYSNPAAEKLFAKRKEDFLGYNFGLPISADEKEVTLIIRKGEVLCDVEMRVVPIQWQKRPAFQLSVRDVTERKRVEEALREKSVDLSERVKELNCLYEISNLVQTPGISDDDFFQGVVDTIPPAFRYPEITVCCLIINEQEYKTRNFKKTDWNICEDIIVDKRLSGSIEICLLKKIPDPDSAQFLKEEKDLIRAVAERLGHIIGRKKTEKELIESEQKIRSIMENSADAIFITDKNGNYTYTNKEVTALLGFTKEEMKSKTIIDMSPQNRINEYLEIFKSIKTEGKLFTEIELLKNDGTYVPTDLNAVILPDGNLYGSCRDITERKQAEETLRISQMKYKTLFDSSPLGITVADKNGKILESNQMAEKLLGLSQEEQKKRKISGEEWKIIRPDGTLMPSEEFASVRAQKENRLVENVEMGIIKAENKITWLNVAAIPLPLESHELVIAYNDITERKQVEKEIQLSAERWRNTFNSITDIIAVVSRDHEFLEINEAGCKSLGLARTEIIGKKCYEIVHQSDSPIFECPCARAMDSKKMEITERMSDGKYYLLTAWPIFDEKNDVVAFSHAIKDITEQKRMEAEKLELEDKFRESQKMESIGTLAGGIAHDFNNLLTVIQGHAQMAMMTMDESNALYKDLTQIMNSSTRAASLTRQLLLFSRKEDIELRTLDLNLTIQNLLKMLNRLIGEDININTKLAPDLSNVEADEGSIEQVIMNLVVNARDAMPDGGELTMTTENISITRQEHMMLPDSRIGNFVRISVADTGCGIPKEILGQIFEPFFSTKEKGKGTGLGLSVVYGIVRSHGGWINTYSEPGQGSIFKIYLPVSSSVLSERSDTGTQSRESLYGNGEHIFVIEDEQGILDFASSALRQFGYTVRLASDGQQAKSVFDEAKGNFQLIISDVILPDINGFDLVIKLTKDHPEIPVLMCSGYTEERVKQSIIQERGYRFLQKPYSMNMLLSEVKKTILKSGK